ncbi:MAG: hypothetical protein IKC24_04245 [Oscillospiraceae bacterium]|nr:hypothetical protein [Oscillospiraceae bacterium]
MEPKNEISTPSNETCNQTANGIQSALTEFEFWLRDLVGCASYKIFSCMSVDHSAHNVIVCDYDNAFHTKARCRQAAEIRLENAYCEAVSKMNELMKPFEKNSVYQAFQNNFDKRLDVLKNYLRQFRNAQTACITDQMDRYLIASKIHEAAQRISEQLYSEYILQNTESYISGICYTTDDPSRFEDGIAKLVAKAFTRHEYDCLDAIYSLETDMRDRLENFQRSFNAQIQQEILASIVEPILTLLPKLSDAATNSAD